MVFPCYSLLLIHHMLRLVNCIFIDINSWLVKFDIWLFSTFFKFCCLLQFNLVTSTQDIFVILLWAHHLPWEWNFFLLLSFLRVLVVHLVEQFFLVEFLSWVQILTCYLNLHVHNPTKPPRPDFKNYIIMQE